MKLDQFIEFTNLIQAQAEKERELYRLSVDLIAFSEPWHHMVNIAIRSHWGEGGLDWWSWYCWDNNFGRGGLTATEADGTPICFDLESLWNYLEANHKK